MSAMRCSECGAYSHDGKEAHAPKCSLASLEYRAWQAGYYYDAWIKDSQQHTKLRVFWKDQVTLWQGKCLILRQETPDTCKGGDGPSQLQRNGPRLQTLVKLFATPNARDWKEQTLSPALARAHQNPKRSKQLPRQLSAQYPELHGGQLNPTWVEWLMGFPLDFTDLKDSEMPLSRKSHTSSGKQSMK